MIICNCAGKGHAAICHAIDHDGLRTVKQLQQRLGVADDCKTCAVAVQAIIKLTLTTKAANKALGIEIPVKLDIAVILSAIAEAEAGKLHALRNPAPAKRLATDNRKVRSRSKPKALIPLAAE